MPSGKPTWSKINFCPDRRDGRHREQAGNDLRGRAAQRATQCLSALSEKGPLAVGSGRACGKSPRSRNDAVQVSSIMLVTCGSMPSDHGWPAVGTARELVVGLGPLVIG